MQLQSSLKMPHATRSCQRQFRHTDLYVIRILWRLRTDSSGLSDNGSDSNPQRGTADGRRGQHPVLKPYARLTNGDMAAKEGRVEIEASVEGC